MKRLINLFAVIFSLALIASCEKPSDIPGPGQTLESENQNFDPTGSVERIVTINASEIGGEGLKLVSSRSIDAPLLNESFLTAVSKDGEQLLTVLDSNEELRALTLSTPSQPEFEVMKIDAKSTALSLVFVSPGILTVNPTEAKTTISNIEDLDSFKPLAKFLRNNLQSKSLNDLVETDVYYTLLSDCVEEYNNYKTQVAKGESSKGANNWINDFSVNHSNGKIEFKNRGFRFVCVTEIDKSSANSIIKTRTVLPEMKGCIPLSWGSIFTLSYLSPTKKSINYLPPSNTKYSEYWVSGMGKKKSTVIPPNSVTGIGTHDLETALYYIIFPIVDLTTGGISLMNMPAEEVKKLATILKISKPLVALYDADGVKSTCRELVNFTTSVCGQILKNSEAIKLLSSKFGATIVAEASTLLKASGVIMGAGNLAMFVTNLYLVERYTKFIVIACPPVLPTLSSPRNGSRNLPEPVNLKWNAMDNADSYELQVSKYNNFSSIVFCSKGFSSNQQQVSSLVKGVKYYWHVRAKNQFGYSLWSETWSFTK